MQRFFNGCCQIKKSMQKLIIILFAVIYLAETGCTKKTNDNTACSAGTVVDFTGLDGCGLLITLDNGQNLEPYQLPPGTRLEAGKKVCVKYEELTDRASICMAGMIVKITSLKYLP
jgi:hypothetical protein